METLHIDIIHTSSMDKNHVYGDGIPVTLLQQAFYCFHIKNLSLISRKFSQYCFFKTLGLMYIVHFRQENS